MDKPHELKFDAQQSFAMSDGTAQSSYNPTTRTMCIRWLSQPEHVRYDRFGQSYLLRLHPEGCDLSRANAGGPFKFTHRNSQQSELIGNIVEESMTLSADCEGLGEVRLIEFPDDELQCTGDDQRAAMKVAKRYLRPISMDATLKRTTVTEFPDEPGRMPDVDAWEWEVSAVSAVFIQQDPKSFTMEASMPSPIQQPNQTTPEPAAPAAAVTPTPPLAPNVAELTAAAEAAVFERQDQIHDIALVFGLSVEDEKKLARSKEPIAQISQRLINKKAKDGDAMGISASTSFTRDEGDTLREAIVDGISARALGMAPSDKGRQFMSLNLVGVARHYLRQIGASSAEFMSEMDVVNAALGFSSAPGQTMSSDLPILLQQVGNRSLVKGYAAEPRDFERLVRFEQVSDFRKRKAVKFGAMGALQRMQPGKAPDVGTFVESAEEYGTAPWGRGWFVGRDSLISDDTGAFGRLPFEAGKKIRLAELTEFWTKFYSAKLADGKLVCSAEHGNITASGGGLPSVDEVAKGVLLMAARQDLDGTRLNIQPDILIGPAALWGAVMKLTGKIAPTQVSDVVPAVIGTLTPIVQGRLDAYSSKKWWLASSAYPCFVFTTLNGQSEPRYRSQVDFETEGVKAIINYDFDVDAIDSLGLYQNKGEN